MLLKSVLRNIRRRVFLNFIKVIGLALGLCGITFIVLFVKNELTYDTWHPNASRIYRFTYDGPDFEGRSHFARIHNSRQVPELAAHFPEIEKFVRLAPIRSGVIMYNESNFSFDQGFECDSTFFELFDAELLIGDKNSILNEPASMVITEAFSRNVFGNENPIGKVFTVPIQQFYGEDMHVTVKGVMEAFPPNSHFHPDFVTTPVNGEINGWAWTYLLLTENSDPDKIVSGYPTFLAKHKNKTIQEIENIAYLQKLTDIHLYSDKLREIEPNGSITNVTVLVIAALILLFISMSNFASLELGMAGFNQKMLSINRILGASKRIKVQFLFLNGLFILLASIAFSQVLAFMVDIYIQRYYNINLLDGNLMARISILFVFCIIGVVAGLHPAIKQPFNKFTSEIRVNYSRGVSRSIIIAQFVFAIVLVVSVLVISRQTQYVLNNTMGADNKNLICFDRVHSAVQQKFELFKSELLKYPTIESVSAMIASPGGEANDQFPFELEGYQKSTNQQNDVIGVFSCDYSFIETFKLELLGGRKFSNKHVDADGSGEFIINETAMHMLNHTNPENIIGKNFKLLSVVPEVKIPDGQIIGVVKDFHLSSMKKKVNPLVLFKMKDLWLGNFVISYKPDMRESALADIRKVWKEMFPGYPFDYEHVDTMYQNIYKTEMLQRTILSVFTFISLFICSMGLLGLTLLITQQRTKEIGIRKVNGAKISEILTLLNKDFVKWVVIAFVIATPIGWYAMDKWLQNFAYKAELSWWIFALAGLLALGVALLTVSYQSWRAATRNPVEALRYE